MRRIVPVLVLAGGTKTAEWAVQRYVADLKLAACGGPDPGAFNRPASLPITDGILSRMAMAEGGMLSSILTAKTCDDVFLALNGGSAPPACDAVARTCDGDVAVDCTKYGDRLLEFRTDCSGASLVCTQGDCGLPACVSSSCDTDTGALVTCNNGVEDRVECEYLGLTCGYSNLNFECVGTGDTCSPNVFESTCDGTVLNLCLGAKVGKIDCSSLTETRRQCNGSWVSANKDEVPEQIAGKDFSTACSQAGLECQDGTSSCDGTLMNLCVDGYVVAVARDTVL